MKCSRSTGFDLALAIVASLFLAACTCPSPPTPTSVVATKPPAAVPTDPPTPTAEPTVPPESPWIAFIDQNRNACIIRQNGEGLTCATADGEDSSPAWSPDGQTLAFIHREDAPPSPGQVMLYDLASGTSTPLPLEITDEFILGSLGDLAWAPDGQHLLIDHGTSIARGAHIVTVPTGQTVRELSVIGRAHWSPDGKRLALSQIQPLEVQHPDEIGDALSLAVLELDQPTPTIVIEGTYEMSYFLEAWLPDGRVLYYRWEWDATENMPAGSSLWTIDPDVGGEPQPAQDIPMGFDRDAMKAELPEAFQADAWNLGPSSDERCLLFQWGSWPDTGVYLFDRVEGGEPLMLINGIDPTWQPVAD
jgi:dipeptidyl aminopeptidase/acylaminoacyl peptidase